MFQDTIILPTVLLSGTAYPPDSPPPGTHQLNLDANNPPSSHSSPALSLSPLSFITLSHPHCTLPHLSPWEPLWDWVLFL